MSFQEVRAKLNQLFASEQYDSFIEFWYEMYHTLKAHQQLQLLRALTAEWKHDKLLRSISV